MITGIRTPRANNGNGGGSSVAGSVRSPKRQERQTNFKVVIRVRPPLPRELSGEVPFQNIIAVDEREQLITISENIDEVLDENGQLLTNPGPYSTHSFVFDHVYDQSSSQKKVRVKPELLSLAMSEILSLCRIIILSDHIYEANSY